MVLEPARHFVDRDKEVDLVADQIVQLTGDGDAQFRLLNFFGAPGIGKTALLNEIGRNYAQNEQLFTLTLTLSDLKPGTGLPEAKIYVLQLLVEALAALVPAPFQRLFARLEQLSADDSAAADGFLETMTTSLQGLNKPLLLIVDSWEGTPDALITWVERLLLLPMVRANRIIGVFGSQVPLRWRQFEVRRKVRAHALDALSAEHTQAQLDDQALGRAAYTLTFGHPFANEIVFELARQHAAPVRWLGEHQREVAQEIVTRLQKRVLAGMSDELKLIFSVIALFREFDVNTLRLVLPQFHAEFKNRSQSALLISIKQLLDTRLVSWSDEKRAYQLDPTVRKIFARALELNDPQRYARIRDAAIGYYKQLISDVPGSRNTYLVEYYYHTLAGDTPETRATLEQSLAGFFHRYYVSPDKKHLDDQAITTLRETFGSDQELQHTLAQHQLPSTLLADTLKNLNASVGVK